MFRNSPKITYKPITKVLNRRLDIKLGKFTARELDSIAKKKNNNNNKKQKTKEKKAKENTEKL